MRAKATKPLLLNGPSGVGKSTIGRRLARSVGATFVDLDQRFAALTASAPAVFARRHGELRYREVELDVLRGVMRVASPSTVIALGGGTLLDSDVRRRLLEQARVVSLTAPNSVLAERAAKRARSKNEGPFAKVKNRAASVERYMLARGPGYMEAHECVSTHEVATRVMTSRILRAWRERSVVVPLGRDSYPVWLDGDVGITAGSVRRPGSRRASELGEGSASWLVADSSIPPQVLTRVARSIRARVTTVSTAGKQGWDSFLELLAVANRYEVDRTTLTVAMGGGSIGDLVGFLAATWMRGVPLAHVPTTLLAMIDSSIGGKTGLDLESGGAAGFSKNVIGVFHQPVAVLIDSWFLKSLSKRVFASAIGEITKYAILDDRLEWLQAKLPQLLARDPAVLDEVIEVCVSHKARVVAADPRDQGNRLALNLGHTWGHAVESASAGALLHGEAVGIGLCFELAWMEQTCGADPHVRCAVESILRMSGLPTRAPLWADAAHGFLDADKKRVQADARMYRLHSNAGVIDSIPWRQLRREFRSVARFLDRTTRNVYAG